MGTAIMLTVQYGQFWNYVVEINGILIIRLTRSAWTIQLPVAIKVYYLSAVNVQVLTSCHQVMSPIGSQCVKE
jgi:hypothetical protein